VLRSAEVFAVFLRFVLPCFVLFARHVVAGLLLFLLVS